MPAQLTSIAPVPERCRLDATAAPRSPHRPRRSARNVHRSRGDRRAAPRALTIEHADPRTRGSQRPRRRGAEARAAARDQCSSLPCDLHLEASAVLDEQGDALAAADTGRRDARSARPTARSSRASVSASRTPVAPSGWPMAMAPPLTLSLLLIEPELAHAGQRLRAERLVDLDAVDPVERQPGSPRAARGSPAPGRCP